MKTITYNDSEPDRYVTAAALTTAGLAQGLSMKADDVRYIVIHCSATRADHDYSPAQLAGDHRRRGFRTGGYHFYVQRDGTVSQYRQLLEKGAHCRGSNHNSIGICYEGGLDSHGSPADTLTPVQRLTISRIIAALQRVMPAQLQVRGHRDMPGACTDCPCLDAAAVFGRA